MAKKKVVKDETKVDTRELFAALAALAEERGLPSDYLIEKIKTAIIGAIKKDYLVGDENVVVDIIPEMDVFAASRFARFWSLWIFCGSCVGGFVVFGHVWFLALVCALRLGKLAFSM